MTVGICFSKDVSVGDPLGHIGVKRPTYDRLLELCLKEGWKTFIFTRRTYLGNGIFDGAWEYKARKLSWTGEKIRADLVYDRTGGIKFPLQDDTLKVVNTREFKILCWDKWKGYELLKKYMPDTFWVGDLANLGKVISKVKTDFVVVKPHNGLKGLGICIGPKKDALTFEYPREYKSYIVQEFIDTSGGLPPITSGMHDLRVVVVNKKVVWTHVRVPPGGSFKANAAGGGVLREVDYESEVPLSIKTVSEEVIKIFYQKYDNPIYSLDFGVGNPPAGGASKPYIFEINDQIGFPRWEMKNRDNFLNELIANFKSRV